MSSYSVLLTFNDGSGDYTLPLVQTISDPQPGTKGVFHEGTRASGCIYIPSGLKSHDINVEGILWDSDGYEDLTDAINELKAQITTLPATLTLKHDCDDSGYINDWQFSVVRSGEIEIEDNKDMRTDYVRYRITFKVLSY